MLLMVREKKIRGTASWNQSINQEKFLEGVQYSAASSFTRLSQSRSSIDYEAILMYIYILNVRMIRFLIPRNGIYGLGGLNPQYFSGDVSRIRAARWCKRVGVPCGCPLKCVSAYLP